MNNKIINKLMSRKDMRDKMTEEEARDLFQEIKSKYKEYGKLYKYTDEEIEIELKKIYDSSLDLLLEEDSKGTLLFGGISLRN